MGNAPGFSVSIIVGLREGSGELGLTGRQPTIDGQANAGDGRRLIAGQEEHGIGDVLSRRDPAQRIPALGFLEDLRIGSSARFPGLGANRAGATAFERIPYLPYSTAISLVR